MKKLGKRIITGLAALVISGSGMGGAVYAETVPTAQAEAAAESLEGKSFTIDISPFTSNGYLMLPVRPVAEAMGWSVDVNEYAVYLKRHGAVELIPGWLYYTHYQSTVGLTADEFKVYRTGTLGDMDMYHFDNGHFPAVYNEVCPGGGRCPHPNDTAAALAVQPVTKNGEVFIAQQDLSQAVYADISWDGQTRTVTVTTELLPYYDGAGLPAGYRESLLKRTLAAYPNAVMPAALPSPANKPALPGESVRITEAADSAFDLRAFEDEVFRLVNEARKLEGVGLLASDSLLSDAARVRANELPVENAHTRPDGRKCSTAFEECGVTLIYNGENIAMNMLGDNTSAAEMADAFVTIWLGSPGHRANILHPNARYLGVGAALLDDGTIYAAQMFAK